MAKQLVAPEKEHVAFANNYKPGVRQDNSNPIIFTDLTLPEMDKLQESAVVDDIGFGRAGTRREAEILHLMPQRRHCDFTSHRI